MKTDDIRQIPADTIGGRTYQRRCRGNGEPYGGPDRRCPGPFSFQLQWAGTDRGWNTFCSLDGRSSFSVTVSDGPTVAANNLPVRVVRQMSPQVINCLSRNKDALLDFWYHGETWIQPEVGDFIQKLDRV
jgi:hypothetical protein